MAHNRPINLGYLGDSQSSRVTKSTDDVVLRMRSVFGIQKGLLSDSVYL